MIDILFFIILVLATIQGWRKGLILALFSVFCGLAGLAAAVKLSAILATHMKSDLHLESRWLPVIAFVLVFVMVALIIRWAARLLEKLIRLVLLEWLNKLGGILLFIFLYLSVYSIILFYGTQAKIISKQALEDSHVYSLIAPLGPAVIRFISGFIPYGMDMFTALEGFFGQIAQDIR
ncbi:MAG TPA: colicin V production protein [Chitinophagaceae bacterium]|jgi:membrane protein required for colicin V production|nr:colicin V production protein [Chitinophagaceae bacterium]